MKASTRQRALRQAAKIALGATFAGCASSVIPNTGTDAAREVSARDVIAVVDVVREASVLACDLTERNDAGISASAQECCFTLTTMAVPPGQTATAAIAASWSNDPSLSGCCHGLYDTGGHRLVEFAYGPDAHWGYQPCNICAAVAGDPSACTPWGPPVPPAMRGVEARA